MQDNDWLAANQRYLMARLAAVRAVLARHAAKAHAGAATTERSAPSSLGRLRGAFARRAPRARAETAGGARDTSIEAEISAAAAALTTPSALDRLCAALGLSSFERDVLLLCAGMELDGAWADLCAAAQGDARRTYPTFGLALAALPDAHFSAAAPVAPLRRWRLVELVAHDSATSGKLFIDERVLQFLAGISFLDERIAPLVRRVEPGSALPLSRLLLMERMAEPFLGDAPGPLPVVLLEGAPPDELAELAAHAMGRVGLALFRMEGNDIPAAAAEREAFARLWEREATLGKLALLIACDSREQQRSAGGLAHTLSGVVLVTGTEELRGSRRLSRLEVPELDSDERLTLWRAALGPAALWMNGQLEAAAANFAFGPTAIYAVAAELRGEAPEPTERDAAELGKRLWQRCREHARARLDELAARIEPAAEWEDLVLPPAQVETLRTIPLHVRRRATVYDDWGFAASSSRGLGVSALFAGPSGTGKTMAAEVLANELELDLYRIDLSQVVSKYIGETEKNLRRVFDAAEGSGAILLFDEADALFGKRSEVKDSHDRYANIEVSYLLQRMEAYRGLAILTTNLRSALDPAFLRRIRFTIQFPFPDVTLRTEIWRRIFPARTPTEGLVVERLARLNVAGGNIRNIALNAAFLAAAADQPVRMGHLLRAVQAEYSKLERPLTDAETRGWE